MKKYDGKTRPVGQDDYVIVYLANQTKYAQQASLIEWNNSKRRIEIVDYDLLVIQSEVADQD